MLYIFHCGDFCEIISLVLFEALKENGIQCELSRDISGHPDDTWLLFCFFFDIIKWPKKYIVYQTEPMLKAYSSDNLYIKFLRGASQIWEYSQYNLPFLKTLSNDVIYMPFRYAHCLETWNEPGGKIEGGQPPAKPQVYFIGHPTDYRKKIIEKLRKEGLEVVFPAEKQLLVFGQEREKQIKNAKVNLVLHNNERYSPFPQDISRIFTFGAKRCFMISEPIGECAVKSLIQCQVDELPQKIKFYLLDENLRKENAEALYQEIRTMTMASEIQKNRNHLKI